MRIVCIYPGRFQPFHSSHYTVYKYLVSKFGANNVYIVTSNKTQAKSPFNFKEKVLIMNGLFGIPASQILYSTTPYRVESLYSKFNKDNTVLVYASTEKDPGRTVGRYFKGQLPKNPKPYKQQAYIIPVPLISNKIQGQEISGTTIRTLFASSKLTIQEKKKLFKQIFGKYDQTIFKLFIKKLSPIKESLIKQGIYDKGIFKCVFMAGTPGAGKSTIMNQLFHTDLNISSYGLKVVSPDYLFVKRMNASGIPIDMRNSPESQNIKRQKLRQQVKGTMANQINQLINARLGIILDITGGCTTTLLQTRKKALENGYDVLLIYVNTSLKTALRRNAARDRKVPEQAIKDSYAKLQENKKIYQKIFGNDFIEIVNEDNSSIDSKIRSKINQFINQPPKNPIALKWIQLEKKARNIKESYNKRLTENSNNNRILLTCGGASGHMTHIFQDTQLTFNDFRTIINNLLSGRIDLESEATMKYDGQNINVSWKNGRLIGARNKGHLKNFGQTAPDILGIKNIFAGRGAIQEAFVYAMIDLQRAFSSLSKQQLDQIFGQGKRWLALEIIYPKTANVIPYDKSMLVFHNITQVDKAGNKIKVDNSMAKSIYSILTSVNANIQKHFSIQPPTVVKLPKVTNFSKRKSYYLNKLNMLQKRFNLSGNSTLQDYNDAYWEALIRDKAASFNYEVPKSLMKALITRWSGFDKSASINKIKSLCNNPQFLNWILAFDKNDHYSIYKKNAYDWQTLFMELTSEVLKNLGEYMVVNPNNVVKKLSSELLAIAEQIKGSNNLALIEKAAVLMNRINALGGIKAIVPTQGIVFTYKGNIYKATGLFSDINQIMGALKYAR